MSFSERILSMGMQGADVALLHKLLKFLRYKISEDEVQKFTFGESTRQTIAKFQSDNRLEPSGVVDEPTATKMYELAKEQNYPMVAGTVVTKAGVGAKGLRVIAVDKRTGNNDVRLGETITDRSGNYTILYGDDSFRIIGKKNVDIEIKIVDGQVEGKIYGYSSVHFNSNNFERINLILKDTESIDKTSEFTQITSELKPHIAKESSFKDLHENKVKQEISFLANKTGWDARLVAMVSLAEKYAAESGIPPDLYYALFRAWISTDADILYKTTVDTVKMIWEKAINEKIIDASLQGTIDQNIVKFKNISRIHLLDKARPIGVSSLKDLLSISLIDTSQQQEFVELYLSSGYDLPKFWQKIELKFGKEKAEKLQLDGKLAYLTMNNAQLISKLYSENAVQRNPADLIAKGLYKKEAWAALLGDRVPIPKDFSGEDGEKKIKYIEYMISILKISYPTLVIAEMVNTDELPIRGGSDVKNEVYKFLCDNYEKFRIGVQPLEKILKENPDIRVGEKALKELLKLQRVYQITHSDESMKTLVAKNIDSAYTVIQYGKEEFINTFGNDLGGDDNALLIYSKAHMVHSTVLNTVESYLTYRTTPKVYAISAVSKGET